MGAEEAKLLRSAQSGDDHAFGRLVEPYLDPLYRLASRILNGRPEAEDAVQEALYRAWRALPTFRQDAKFSTWLYRITWRVCVDMLNKHETLPLDLDVKDRSRERDPERRLESIENKSVIEEALKDLSVHYRTALTLFYIEDLSVREIGEILGIPVATVKTHLHRARQAMKARLARFEQKG